MTAQRTELLPMHCFMLLKLDSGFFLSRLQTRRVRFIYSAPFVEKKQTCSNARGKCHSLAGSNAPLGRARFRPRKSATCHLNGNCCCAHLCTSLALAWLLRDCCGSDRLFWGSRNFASTTCFGPLVRTRGTLPTNYEY